MGWYTVKGLFTEYHRDGILSKIVPSLNHLLVGEINEHLGYYFWCNIYICDE